MVYDAYDARSDPSRPANFLIVHVYLTIFVMALTNRPTIGEKRSRQRKFLKKPGNKHHAYEVFILCGRNIPTGTPETITPRRSPAKTIKTALLSDGLGAHKIEPWTYFSLVATEITSIGGRPDSLI